jgi:hypothetical protein
MNYIRSSARVPLRLPVQVRWKGRAGVLRGEKGNTANISGNGAFFVLPGRIRPETSLRFRVEFTPGAAGVRFELVGRGRVVRRSGPGEAPGVAIIIDDYHFRVPRARPRLTRRKNTPVRTR